MSSKAPQTKEELAKVAGTWLKIDCKEPGPPVFVAGNNKKISSIEVLCNKCNLKCYLDPRDLPHLEANQERVIMCIECYKKILID